MYRVELKVSRLDFPACLHPLFLMYRVELKGKIAVSSIDFGGTVPNVPCGVESVILYPLGSENSVRS